MNHKAGLILYFLCGFCSLFFEPAGPDPVAAFLCASALLFLKELIKNPAVYAGLILLFSCFQPFWISAAFFCPLCVYLLVGQKQKLSVAFPVPILLSVYAMAHHGIPSSFTAVWGLLALSAAVTSHTQAEFEVLRQQGRSASDSSRENEILLEETNRILLEKQDYEINNAMLKERNRIAREIHDNVGHMLTRSILGVGALKTMNNDAALAPMIGSLEETLKTAMNSIRESVHDLHSEAMDLEQSVRELLDGVTFCSTHLEYECCSEIPRDVKYAFLMIIKEAISNTAKHSNATRISVVIREHPALYQLIIEDNGKSKPEENASGYKTDGIGLSNMRDRVQTLGGNMNITEKGGFSIFVSIPKGRNPEENVHEDHHN